MLAPAVIKILVGIVGLLTNIFLNMTYYRYIFIFQDNGCYHMNPPLGNSKPPNFGKPMDYSHHFHRVCYTGFRPTCAYGVLACGGA